MDNNCAINYVRQFNINETVIWVGAGISSNLPSGLPLGGELTEYVLKKCLYGYEKLLDIWSEINNTLILDFDFSTNYLPRLESILASVYTTEKNLLTKHNRFFQGFKLFNDISYNLNHLCLALLAKKGVIILTTNFDLCIQNAYKDLYGQYPKFYYYEDGSYIFLTDNGGKIIHMHGTIFDLDKMGVTLTRVINGLPKTIIEELEFTFLERKLNIFIGYSLSDTYDVNPFLSGYYKRRKYPHNVFLCHGDSVQEKLKTKVKKILNNECVFFAVDTAKFLINITESNGMDICSEHNSMGITQSWKNKFNDFIDIDYVFKAFSSAEILGFFKIDVELIDPQIASLVLKHGHYYNQLQLNQIKFQLMANSIKWMRFFKNSYTKEYQNFKELLYFRTAFGDDTALIIRSKKMTLKCLQSKVEREEFGWEVMRMIALYSKQIIYDYITGKDVNKQARELILICQTILQKPYSILQNVIKYAACLRYCGILNTIINKHFNDNLHLAMEMYYDFGNIEGITASYRDFAICHAIIRENSQNLDKVRYYLNKANYIAEISGSYAYKKSIKYTECVLSQHLEIDRLLT